MSYNTAVRAYVGACRALAACSNAYAMRINFASVHARPKNEMPTGSPNAYPAGTVIDG